MTRQFIDTNVLVYAHDRSVRRKRTEAQQLLRNLWQSGEGCLSIQVLQEYYVTVTRKVPTPLLPEQAKDIISHLARWRMHSPTVADILEAINIQSRHEISFWDAMIIQSAIRLKCEKIWSEDLNAGQLYAGVTVDNPFN